MVTPAFDEVFLGKIFFELDTDDDFVGFTQTNINGEVVRIDGL